MGQGGISLGCCTTFDSHNTSHKYILRTSAPTTQSITPPHHSSHHIMTPSHSTVSHCITSHHKTTSHHTFQENSHMSPNQHSRSSPPQTAACRPSNTHEPRPPNRSAAKPSFALGASHVCLVGENPTCYGCEGQWSYTHDMRTPSTLLNPAPLPALAHRPLTPFE